MQVFFEESPERLALLRAGHDIELQEPETAVKSDQPKSGSGGGGGGYLGWFSSVHIPYVASVPPPDPDERFARLGQRVTAMHGAYQALAAKCSAQLTREHVRYPRCVLCGPSLRSIWFMCLMVELVGLRRVHRSDGGFRR